MMKPKEKILDDLFQKYQQYMNEERKGIAHSKDQQFEINLIHSLLYDHSDSLPDNSYTSGSSDDDVEIKKAHDLVSQMYSEDKPEAMARILTHMKNQIAERYREEIGRYENEIKTFSQVADKIKMRWDAFIDLMNK